MHHRMQARPFFDTDDNLTESGGWSSIHLGESLEGEL